MTIIESCAQIAFASILLAAYSGLSQAQVIEIDIEQHVTYINDVADNARFAADATPTTRIASRNFNTFFFIGDIVAVNGKAAKGAWIQRGNTLLMRPIPTSGQAISDVTRDWLVEQIFEFLQADGTPIGTITASGFIAGPTAPGAPSSATASNIAITGGTGAFLGARGQISQGRHPAALPARAASITEDPTNRRLHGGGKTRFVMHIIPNAQPEILSTPPGHGVLHSDFTPVTETIPARPGEVLILSVRGLGPTLPGVDPGQRFSESPIQEVNSPIEVTVNGKPAEVITKVGWPGTTDRYRVDVRIPDSTSSGVAAVRLSAAWLPSPEVLIPIR